ncbi:MAG: Gfo/Idh/MocA family oxidoreductase [Candidatus Babeliaceae bacterium]|nr:Gfo/Idh/MocA family oxidoreductase [Candidatus Babeliaceae bacterium]
MNSLFRLGIIGTGQITMQSHLPAALASTKIIVTALVDPQVERAQKLADSYGIKPTVTGHLEEVWGQVDGVVIATPNHTHRDIAIACVKAGVHCLIEKPLASTVAEGEDIVHVAKEHNILVTVGYTTRFKDEVVLFHDLFKSGYFGIARCFVYQFGTVGGWAPLSAYNLDRKRSGGGVLVVTGSHFIDRMLYWFGYPDQYAFEDDSLGGPEANCVARVTYSSGGYNFEGTIRLSKTVAMQPGFVMETDQGRLVFSEKVPLFLGFRPFSQPSLQTILRSRQGPVFSQQKSPFQLQLENFVEACQGREQPMVSAEQGLESVRLINALYSCRTAMKEVYS